MNKTELLMRGIDLVRFRVGFRDPICDPLKVFLKVTNRCEGVCINCQINQSHCSELDTDGWLLVIERLSRLRLAATSLTGGDPMMRKDIALLVRKLSSISKVTLNTAASMVFTREKIYREVLKMVHFVYFSLDAHDKELNNRIKGPGAFERMQRLIELGKQMRTQMIANMTVSKLNIDEIESTVELAHRLGVSAMTIKPVQYLEPLHFTPPSDILLDEYDLSYLMGSLQRVQKKYPGFVPLSQYLSCLPSFIKKEKNYGTFPVWQGTGLHR